MNLKKKTLRKGYHRFWNLYVKTLDKHAPKKTNILRANQRPHISKELRKEMMERSRVKNIANKSKNPIGIIKWKKTKKLTI